MKKIFLLAMLVIGISVNIQAENIEKMKKSCELGTILECHMLGGIYLNGQGVKPNYEEAVKYYKKSCDGNLAFGCVNVGYAYYSVEKNYEEAATFYLKGAELGNDVAQYRIGFMYLIGKGVDKDILKAHQYFTKSSKQGNADADYGLSVLCKHNPKVCR